MIFKVRKRKKHNWINYKRELTDFTIFLQTDVIIDGEAVLDIVVEAYQDGTDFVEFAQSLSELVASDGIKTTAIVVKNGSWQVILSQDPNYEFDL